MPALHSVNIASSDMLNLYNSLASLGALLLTTNSHAFDLNVSKICKIAYSHIRSLKVILTCLTDDMARKVGVAVVCFRLHYANALLFDLS